MHREQRPYLQALAHPSGNPGTRSGDCQDVVDVTAAVHRAHNTYVTNSLPQTAPPSNEMHNQAVHALLDALNAL